MSLVFAANSAHSNALARQSSAEGGMAVGSVAPTYEGDRYLAHRVPVPRWRRARRQCPHEKRVPAGSTNSVQLAQFGNTCAMCDSGHTKNISGLIALLEAICYPWSSAGKQVGATLDGKSQEFDFFSVAVPEISNTKNQSTDEPIDELCRSLLARITRTIINHETDDWPGDYDRLYALICKVVAQSNLSADKKRLLTQRLIGRVTDLEKKWPKLKHME